MVSQSEDSKGTSQPTRWTLSGDVDVTNGFKLTNGNEGYSEILFDYERAVGGLPFIGTSAVVSNGEPVVIDVILSETFEGIESGTGMLPVRYRIIKLTIRG